MGPSRIDSPIVVLFYYLNLYSNLFLRSIGSSGSDLGSSRFFRFDFTFFAYGKNLSIAALPAQLFDAGLGWSEFDF